MTIQAAAERLAKAGVGGFARPEDLAEVGGELRITSDGNDLVWDGAIWVLGDFDRADVMVKTIGQLRMLCASLGITLTEQPE